MSIRTLLIAGAMLAAGPSVHATLTGMDLTPLGDRGSAGVKFAYWDLFTQTAVTPAPTPPTFTANGIADASSTLTGLSLTQTTAHANGVQGSGLLLPTGGPTSDAYYSSTFSQSWTLLASTSIDITTMTFQIKTANVNESVMNQLFVPTLNGVGPATFISGIPSGDAPISGTFVNYVLEYQWVGLDIDAGSSVQITFAMAGGSSGNFTRKPVDFVSLDVATVPEPGSAALCALAGAMLLPRRRRKA